MTADEAGEVAVPVSLEILPDGDVSLTFGPMPPAQLLDAVGSLETIEGQLSFHRRLVEALESQHPCGDSRNNQ